MKKTFEPYDTDKKTHGYIPFYEDNFSQYRNKVKTFLEIGVHAGESLKAWRDYFPKAQIVGAEINPNAVKIKDEPRISLAFGDATKLAFVDDLFDRFGNFDIVVDDGSHCSVDMRQTFGLLWPLTNLVYCVEDLGTQYPENIIPNKGTKFGKRWIPDNNSYMNDLKGLIDDINTWPEVRDDIFKIVFHKWQTYIYRRPS